MRETNRTEHIDKVKVWFDEWINEEFKRLEICIGEKVIAGFWPCEILKIHFPKLYNEEFERFKIELNDDGCVIVE